MKTSKKNEGNNEIQRVSIEPTTQLIFTIKGFIGTIASMLGIFASFYFMVFIPRTERTEKHQKDLYNQQLTYISQEFIKINSTITRTNNNLEALTNRFNDLNDIVIQNSGGGFSYNEMNYDLLNDSSTIHYFNTQPIDNFDVQTVDNFNIETVNKFEETETLTANSD